MANCAAIFNLPP
jgi:hypothetical protein